MTNTGSLRKQPAKKDGCFRRLEHGAIKELDRTELHKYGLNLTTCNQNGRHGHESILTLSPLTAMMKTNFENCKKSSQMNPRACNKIFLIR